MPPINLDTICIDDLQQLRGELNEFFRAYDASESCYCDGNGEYVAIALQAEEAYKAVRKRIRDLALDLGIHAEFLDEYELTRSKSRIAA